MRPKEAKDACCWDGTWKNNKVADPRMEWKDDQLEKQFGVIIEEEIGVVSVKFE